VSADLPIAGRLTCYLAEGQAPVLRPGANCVRKSHVNEGITRCATTGNAVQLRSVVRAALAAVLFVVPVTTVIGSQTVAMAGVATTAAAKLRMAAWHYALGQRGKPYIWGGTGPAGFDCSGLVYAAYRSAGVDLPRTTYEMLASSLLVRISKANAHRGDLAFYGTGHVELYAWGDKTFGAQDVGTLIGFHVADAFWHPTLYFRVRS
jgi:cell wall-associated NlpC family hydrolase